jgi:hypothetical protein
MPRESQRAHVVTASEACRPPPLRVNCIPRQRGARRAQRCRAGAAPGSVPTARLRCAVQKRASCVCPKCTCAGQPARAARCAPPAPSRAQLRLRAAYARSGRPAGGVARLGPTARCTASTQSDSETTREAHAQPIGRPRLGDAAALQPAGGISGASRSEAAPSKAKSQRDGKARSGSMDLQVWLHRP